MFVLLQIIPLISSQLVGSVGPLSSVNRKINICNILNFSNSSDIGPAIQTAFDQCVKTTPSSVLYLPPGNYSMYTWVSLDHGRDWAFQIDGVIFRQGTDGGHMIRIKKSSNFEVFSSTKTGAIQGYGYKFHMNDTRGPRILRVVESSDFSIHDLKLVDSPAFHMIIDNCKNAEIYNIVIRGGNRGGLDGINISGFNNYVHHVEVTNRDECVTIKNPASNFLIDSIYCNCSGGTNMGSLGNGTNISNILYQNVYSQNCNNMFMIKSYTGDGKVENLTLRNFIGHDNAYGFNINQYWYRERSQVFSGPTLLNIVIDGFSGTIVDPIKRPPFRALCIEGPQCKIFVKNFTLTGVNSSRIAYTCENAYGTGIEECLRTNGTYTSTTIQATVTVPDLPKLPDDLSVGLGITQEIEIPDFPKYYFPKGYEIPVPNAPMQLQNINTMTEEPEDITTLTTAIPASQMLKNSAYRTLVILAYVGIGIVVAV